MSKNKQDTNLIAYCGLYCEDCHGYQGKIPDLARDLRKELRAARYSEFAELISKQPFAKVLQNYKECYEILGLMVKFRCKKGCQNGGGPSFCKVRICCQKKGIEGCWECREFEACTKPDFLKKIHGDAHIKNLRAIRRKGKDEFVKGKTLWFSAIKTKSNR
jgi:hypothetical protein